MKRKIFAVLLTAVMVLTLMPAMAFADSNIDLGSCRISFDGDTDYEWAHFYTINGNTEKLSKEQMNITLKNGNETVPADAYELKLMRTWFDQESDREMREDVSFPLGIADVDKDAGFSEYLAVAEAKSGSGYTGKCEATFIIKDAYSLNWICATVKFNSYKEDGWRMHDRVWVHDSEMSEPIVTDGNGKTLTVGTDFSSTWFKRTGNIDEPVTPGTAKDAEYYLDKKDSKKISSYPETAGGYFVDIDGKGKYYGTATIIVDVTTSDAVKVTASTKTVKYSKVKKKAQTVAPIKVSNAKGVVTYSGKGTDSKSKKALKINVNNGKITVKKGTKKGTYKMKVTVTAAGNEKQAKPVTATIKVK